MAEQNKSCASGEIWKGDNNNRGFEILYVIQLFSPTAWSYELAAWAAYSWLNQFQFFCLVQKQIWVRLVVTLSNTLYPSTQVIPGISFGTLYKRLEGGVGGEKIVEIIVGKTLKACGGSISGKAGRDVRRCFTAPPSPSYMYCASPSYMIFLHIVHLCCIFAVHIFLPPTEGCRLMFHTTCCLILCSLKIFHSLSSSTSKSLE